MSASDKVQKFKKYEVHPCDFTKTKRLAAVFARTNPAAAQAYLDSWPVRYAIEVAAMKAAAASHEN